MAQTNAQRLLRLIEDPTDLLGNVRQVAQPLSPGRSNLTWLGITGLVGTNASQATEVGNVVAVPVQVGDLISKIKVPIGKKAYGTVTSAIAALYEGHGVEPALIAQSTSKATVGETVKKPLELELSEPVTITQAMAPNGFIYVVFAVAASSTAELLGWATPVVEAQEALLALSATMPLWLSAKAGTAIKATAESKIPAAAAAVATVPLVIIH
jgi:hypothetical protein